LIESIIEAGVSMFLCAF